MFTFYKVMEWLPTTTKLKLMIDLYSKIYYNLIVIKEE